MAHIYHGIESQVNNSYFHGRYENLIFFLSMNFESLLKFSSLYIELWIYIDDFIDIKKIV